jgi:hypothetical protein
VRSGYTNSAVAAGTYQIQAPGLPFLNFPDGFASANGLVQTAGMASISGSTLKLTDTMHAGEISSAWYAIPVNIQSFTTEFTLQFTSARANGTAFVIQNIPPSSSDTSIVAVSGGPYSLGEAGDGLGYQPISTSVAVKFDVYNGNTTGLYTDGVQPLTPQTRTTGIALSSGHPIRCTLTYGGGTLVLSMKDMTTLKTFSTSWSVNIPFTVSSNTAYVGFTASTGGQTANQSVTSWVYQN